MRNLRKIIILSFFVLVLQGLSAEPIKTSETTFILTEDNPTVEYKVETMKSLLNATSLAVKENEAIYIVEYIPEEVLEGIKFMNAEAVTFTHKNVEVYFHNGITYFIIHR